MTSKSTTVKRKRKPIGYILYEGPSLINGEDIVVIATGFDKSRNIKTGKAIQIWIMSAAEEPTKALRSGHDESVCGSCKHRHFRSCYVNPSHGPASVYKAWKNGSYVWYPSFEVFNNLYIRFGAYGDPAAVPVRLWRKIAEQASSWTGYTHRWKVCDEELKKYVMASADLYEEAQEAMRRGWRPFYVRQAKDPIPQGFFTCPASAEAGKRLTCSECKACKGGEYVEGKGVPTIIAHGPAWKKKYYDIGIAAFKSKKSYAGIGWRVAS